MLMRAVSIVFIGLVVMGCGPSPAMQTRRVEVRGPLPANAAVVVDCDDDEEIEESAAPPKTKVEYVRIEEWQSPPAAREIESKIEPRGDKAPEYVRLPSLTMHREIPPTQTWRTGRYWY